MRLRPGLACGNYRPPKAGLAVGLAVGLAAGKARTAGKAVTARGGRWGKMTTAGRTFKSEALEP